MWLYIPSPFALATAGLNSALPPLATILDGNTELSVTSNGKPMRLRYLRTAWKRANWMRLLFGLTFAPLTLDAGVGQWIASLRASRASLTVRPGHEKALPINAGYGPISHELFVTLAHGSWCLKTCQDSFLLVDSAPFCETWPKWGSMRNGQCYRRPALAQVTGANGFSLWPTTRASDSTKGQNSCDGSGTPHLTMRAAQWPTPDCNTATYSNGKMGPNIRQAASQWTTPQAHDVTERGSGQQPSMKAGNACLARDARTWPTPAARDAKGQNSAEHMERDARNHTDQLANFVSHCLPPPLMSMRGQTSSPSAQTSPRRLNPAFGCWLMGLPSWWTNIARSSCDASEMASYRCRLQQQLSRWFGDSESGEVAV